MLCCLFDLSMFEVDDTPPDSHCEVCDPWEGGKDPWIRKGAIEQQRKTTMFSPIPPRLSPEELVQLNKWLATPISTPAPTRPPLPSTPTSTKSVFLLSPSPLPSLPCPPTSYHHHPITTPPLSTRPPTPHPSKSECDHLLHSLNGKQFWMELILV